MVEDEAFLAMTLQDLLTDAGYCVFGAACLSDAMDIAASERVDGAVLDINLHGETVYPLASRLRERGIPFVFATAYSGRSIPEAFRDCEVVRKPYTSDAIIDAVEGMMAGRRGVH
ncbi:MAG TPA: response regulator [Lysobacter sp.]